MENDHEPGAANAIQGILTRGRRTRNLRVDSLGEERCVVGAGDVGWGSGPSLAAWSGSGYGFCGGRWCTLAGKLPEGEEQRAPRTFLFCRGIRFNYPAWIRTRTKRVKISSPCFSHLQGFQRISRKYPCRIALRRSSRLYRLGSESAFWCRLGGRSVGIAWD